MMFHTPEGKFKTLLEASEAHHVDPEIIMKRLHTDEYTDYYYEEVVEEPPKPKIDKPKDVITKVKFDYKNMYGGRLIVFLYANTKGDVKKYEALVTQNGEKIEWIKYCGPLRRRILRGMYEPYNIKHRLREWLDEHPESPDGVWEEPTEEKGTENESD